MKSFIIIMLSAISLSAWAEKDCTGLLNFEHSLTLNEEPEWSTRLNLSESERTVIRDIFNTAIPSSEKIEAAYVKYVEFTLAKLSPNLRQQIAERMKDEEVIFIPYWDNYTGAMREGIKVVITAPDGYQKTATLFATKIHELQHLINFITADTNLQRAIRLIRFYPWVDMLTDSLLKQRYYDEFSAMRAEWEFMSLVPEDLLRTEMQFIKTTGLIKRLKVSQERRIMNSRLSFEEYIRAEHKAGRHSLAFFRKDIWLARLAAGVPLYILVDGICQITDLLR